MTQRTPNDDRSDTLNPNNEAQKATNDNHSRQIQANKAAATAESGREAEEHKLF